MSSFTTPLKLEYIDGFTWRVIEEFVYHVGDEGSYDTIRVPAGEETDFASIPRVFWRVLPPTGVYGKAAVIHDHLYKTGARPKHEADLIFLEAMDVLGTPSPVRHTMYWAVKMFGFAAWNKHRKRDKSG
jgi:hypothetical protein